jgi:hypothetical protein
MYNFLGNWTFKEFADIMPNALFFFKRKLTILGRKSIELILDPFIFITYYFWKILRNLDCRLTK